MKIIRKVRNTKKHLAFLVLMACSLMVAGLPVHAEETISARLSVNQTFRVTGSTVSNVGDIFEYNLTAMTEEAPMPAGSTQERYQFSIRGNQSMEIEPMTYSNTGIYEYRLELVIGSEKRGYTYDKEVYFITVYVKNTENDGLVTEIVAKNRAGDKVGSLNFESTYQPLASDSAIMVDPPVKKTVSGDPSSKGTFKFALMAEEKNNPMPEGSTDGKKIMIIQGEGESDFGVWSYTSTGTYHYTISEEDIGEAGYTYDKTVYTITDVVEDEGGQLIVTRKVTNNDKKQVDTCVFLNQYSTGGSGVDKGNGDGAVKTGDTTNIVFWAVILSMAVIGILVVIIAKKKKKQEKDETENKKNASGRREI